MILLDCTLRDGANVLGKGFPANITKMVIEGLIANNITVIEFGNAGGIGAYDVSNMIAPLTDIEYLDLAKPYMDKAELGMFLNSKRYVKKSVKLAADYGLKFLRVGGEPGMEKDVQTCVHDIKNAGMKVRYAMMKAYLASPKSLSKKAKFLQDMGVDEITIMDSAGVMLPSMVEEYTQALVNDLEIPVGFHGHNNLGMSAANALAAYQNGAVAIDCGLMGMARSAGNLATENAVVLMQMFDELERVNLYGLLDFIDTKLAPEMNRHGYRAAITPTDLILGYSGAHSSFEKSFKKVAAEKKVNEYELIKAVSALNRRDPSETQMNAVAEYLKGHTHVG